MFDKFVTQKILNSFFDIELTNSEESVALESIQEKYSKAISNTIVYTLLAIFPILFLETVVIVSVLIPITMVAGTAWFSISLANMKQKFERFGLELTTNLFEAFSISLGLLFLLSVASLSEPFWLDVLQQLPYMWIFKLCSFILGALIIGNITYKIFIGSIKYDINDAMLAGQNEAAERFYRKALSLLHSVSETLREGKSIQVANYYIGVAFFEVFTFMGSIDVAKDQIPQLLEQSNQLIKQPTIGQKKADEISTNLINTFVAFCINPQGNESQKSLEAINDELWCLGNNENEDQEMIDTRFAIIFQEIANLLESQGQTLFSKKEQ